jgi:hypothetical protein
MYLSIDFKVVSLGCGVQLRQVGVLTERGFRALCAKVWFAIIFLTVLQLQFNIVHSSVY